MTHGQRNVKPHQTSNFRRLVLPHNWIIRKPFVATTMTTLQTHHSPPRRRVQTQTHLVTKREVRTENQQPLLRRQIHEVTE